MINYDLNSIFPPKLVLNSWIQIYQILTNDDEVCIPSLSRILIAVKVNPKTTTVWKIISLEIKNHLCLNPTQRDVQWLHGQDEVKSWFKNSNFCPHSGLECFHQTYLALHITICKNSDALINLQGSGLIGESLDLSHISLAVKYRALENKGVSSGLLCKAQTNCERKATAHSVFCTFTCCRKQQM